MVNMWQGFFHGTDKKGASLNYVTLVSGKQMNLYMANPVLSFFFPNSIKRAPHHTTTTSNNIIKCSQIFHIILISILFYYYKFSNYTIIIMSVINIFIHASTTTRKTEQKPHEAWITTHPYDSTTDSCHNYSTPYLVAYLLCLQFHICVARKQPT